MVMAKSGINISGLGIKQLNLIYRMIKEDVVIRVIRDHDKKPTIELQDESGDNSYESVPLYIMRSFKKRRILEGTGWMPALFITIDTYRIKKAVKEKLGFENNKIKVA